MTAGNDTTPQPPEHYPFKPGEAVYFLPNSPVKRPLPCIPATIVTAPRNGRKLHIQRDDKPRTQTTSCSSLAYRGYCPRCELPAIDDHGILRCPACGTGALAEPPPDALIWRWFPIDAWYTPMYTRRAFEHPDWTLGTIRDHAAATIEEAYTATLSRLALPELDTRSTEDCEGWKADYRAIRLMHFYALLRDDAAFLVTYQALQQSQPPQSPPKPVEWPWKIGEAIYWWPYAGLAAPQPFYPGVIARVTGCSITVQLDDGRKRTVKASNLVYQGFCAQCERPAVVCGQLRCPACGQCAEATPPPEELIRRWFHHGHIHLSMWLREMLLTGCTQEEARDRIYEREAQQRRAKERQRYDTLYKLADLGLRIAKAVHDNDDALPAPRRPELPPLTVVRDADDSTPDGADDLTRWLEQQFDRAA